MTTSGTFSFDAPGDAARAAELRRVKLLATLVLAATLALFVTAKLLLPMHPGLGFVAAFAEAATIGGLADWYAVVAVFRRAFALPTSSANSSRCIFSKPRRSTPSCTRLISAPSSPTGCATANAAQILRAS